MAAGKVLPCFYALLHFYYMLRFKFVFGTISLFLIFIIITFNFYNLCETKKLRKKKMNPKPNLNYNNKKNQD